MKERKGISGSTLKIIAIITMLIDHIGDGVLGRLLVVCGMIVLYTVTKDADSRERELVEELNKSTLY